jgi:ribokinase
LLSLVDVLTPNETEAQIVAIGDVGRVTDAGVLGAQLLETGVGIVVITLGANGALVVTDDGQEHVPGQRVEVVDTTGAGDAFNGALAVALAEGKELTTAVAFANACAALQVTKVGTAPAMPYRADVEALLEDGVGTHA